MKTTNVTVPGIRSTEPIYFPVIASTCWAKNRTFYVRSLPVKIKVAGKFIPKPGYADWEYTEKPSEALPLSRYWWRRFRADSWHCSRCAHWTEENHENHNNS